jgi:hypothetical protein
MKFNYPIKYAAMPIIEQAGWCNGMHELEREYDVVCYIVSKCYLISTLTKYREDGSVIKEHEVVFPYQLSQFDKWENVVPTFDLIYGRCNNSNKVDGVFDTYEEALNCVSTKNNNLCKKARMNLQYSKDIAAKIQKSEDEFNVKLLKYKLLEQQILFSTDNVKPGKSKKLNSVLKIENNGIKIISCNVYEMLQLFADDKFVVYSISQEQYDTLMKADSIDTIKYVTKNSQCLLLHKTKDDFIKLGIEEASGAHYIKDNDVCFDSQIERVTKRDFENLDNDTLIFYTTETIEDLLNSYKKDSEIDLGQIKGTVLKKVK